MKIYVYIIAIGLMGLCHRLSAQALQGEERQLKTATSAAGNYIYLAGQDELFTKDSVILNNIDHFIIQKMDYAAGNANKDPSAFKKVGIAKPVSSEKELQTYFDAASIDQMKRYFKLNTNQDLINYFQIHHSAQAYSLFYQVIETRMAAGQVFLDREVTPDELVIYVVTRVDKDKSQHPWGYAVVQSKVGNYTLKYLKPALNGTQLTDTSVAMNWTLRVQDDLISEIPKPKSKIPQDVDGSVFNLPFSLKSLRAKVTVRRNGQPLQTFRMFPVVSLGGDTLSYTYYTRAKKEEQITAFVTIEDEVYNQGRSSDTTTIYAVEEKSVPLIYGIKVNDVLNGVHIGWKLLPAKPYLRGIEIVRYDSQDKVDSLAILPLRDTAYTDYAIQVGQHYRYQVKALFLRDMGIQQRVAAQGIGTYTKFSKPSPAYNLAAQNEGKNIRLNWQAADEPSFYGYYIYRGTSARRMSVIAGPVKVKTFLDTTQSLNGRSQYFYAVAKQNLRQDTSIYSNVISIQPKRKVTVIAPASMQFYYANGRLDVRWKDTRTGDNAIESFVLQRRRQGDVGFTTVKLPSANAAFYTDSLLEQGATYQYRVASVTDDGTVSEYSNTFEYTLAKKRPETLNMFYAHAVSKGIVINLPQMVYANRKAYNIYRRKAAGGGFEKVGTLYNNQFSFTDTAVQPKTIYIYAVSVTEADNREGPFGKSISVRSN